MGDPEGVLIIDETGFLKKGNKSAGVSRQYSGTAGRIENCQIGVLMAYRSQHGHALLDRELYLPKCWTEDEDRLAEAGIPEDVEFATKPALARQMLRRTFHSDLQASWVTADEIYGRDSQFRKLLEKQGIGYVVTVSCQQRLFLDGQYGRVDEHVLEIPQRQWKKLSCGAGSKGQRFYQWAFSLPDRQRNVSRIAGTAFTERSRRNRVLLHPCSRRNEFEEVGRSGWFSLGNRGMF